MTREYTHTAIEQAFAESFDVPPPRELPFMLAGPIVRRAQPDGVWFWFATSQEVTACTPRIKVFESSGAVNATLSPNNGWMRLEAPELRIARLGDRLWVVLVKARPPAAQPFARGRIYGYELDIRTPRFSTTLAGQNLAIAYRPFTLPTFVLGGDKRRLAQGSCRRPGAEVADAYPAFDAWLKQPENPFVPLARIASPARRPSALILTGDQIYADDVAPGLFRALQRLARDVFGYVEQIPSRDGRSMLSVDAMTVPPHGRKWATAGANSSSGFTTDDGAQHLLSFPEFAAMYLLVFNEQLCRLYQVDDGSRALAGFPAAVEASRRVLANTATYMSFDDHEITDDWNLDKDWVDKTNNPMARRIIANGLAAFWAFQGWGNDPDQFESLKDPISAHLSAMRLASGRPTEAARRFDALLHARHWSFVAATTPPAICVDTRTSREFPRGQRAILSGPTAQAHLSRLVARHRLRRGEALLLVLPTPLLVHPMAMRAQELAMRWPEKRYEGDWELYSNHPAQRADLVRYLRQQLDPPAVVVFSGDVHHGSVLNGLYAGGASERDISAGRGTWAVRIAQVTSSPIKNLKSQLRSMGDAGEHVTARSEARFTPDGTVGMRSDVVNLSGQFAAQSFVWESHLCVVDLPETTAVLDVKATFVGGTAASIKTATASVALRNDPRTFRPASPSAGRIVREVIAPAVAGPIVGPILRGLADDDHVFALGNGRSGAYEHTAIEDAMALDAGAIALDAPVNWVTGTAALPRAARAGAPLTVTLNSARPRGQAQPAPTLTGENAGGNLASLPERSRALVAQIAAARAAFPAAHITLYPFEGKAGWYYSGIRKGLPADPTPTPITAPAAGTDPRRTRAQQAVWEELRDEGGTGSINAYDRQVVTWGRGLGAASGVMGTAIDHALADAAVRDAFLRVGIARQGGKWLVVNTTTGAVEEDTGALALMAGRREILAALSAISEDPAFRQKLADSQWQAIATGNKAGDIPSFAYDWDRRVIQFVAHMTHGGPAFGWGTANGRRLYEESGGRIERVLLAWGRLRSGTPESPSGAFKVSTQTTLTASWIRRMGGGVAADALARQGSGPLELSDEQIRSRTELREHLVLKMPEGGYYVLPALSRDIEQRLGPNVHTRYLQEFNGMWMRALLPRLAQLRDRGLLEHYLSADAHVHAAPIAHEERLWWAKDVVLHRRVKLPPPPNVPDDQVREAFEFLRQPVPARYRGGATAQALDTRTPPPAAQVADWERRMAAAGQRIDAAGHRPGRPLRGAGTAPVDAGTGFPVGFMRLQHKLSMTDAWGSEEEAAQQLLRDYALWQLGLNQRAIPANLGFLFDYIGRSALNDAKARPRYKGVADLGGGLGADGRPTKNWCTDATTRGIRNAIAQLGYAPNNLTDFLFKQPGRVNGQPLQLYGADAYGAALHPGDLIMYLYDGCQYGGHTVTVVEDLGEAFTHISGNTGDAIACAIGEARRLRTPPSGFTLERALKSKTQADRDASNAYIRTLRFGANTKLVYSIVRFSAVFAELARIQGLPAGEQDAVLRTVGLRRATPALRQQPARAALARAAAVPDVAHPVTFADLADDGRRVQDLPRDVPFGGVQPLAEFADRLTAEYVRRGTSPAQQRGRGAVSPAAIVDFLRAHWARHMSSGQAQTKSVADMANAWMRNRQEELLFKTERQIRPSGQARMWNNIWIEPETVDEPPVESHPPGVPLSTTPGGSGAVRVDPRVVTFLTELNRRFPHVSFRTYRGHGSGGFGGRGLSIDMNLRGRDRATGRNYDATTPRRFWDRDNVDELFTHIDATARALDYRYFAIYNDFAVARNVNARVLNGSVGFAGSVDAGGGLNYHGGGVKLHVHIDLIPPALLARDNPARRPGADQRKAARRQFLRDLAARERAARAAAPRAAAPARARAAGRYDHTALEQAQEEDALAHAAAGGPPPASALTWDDATPVQLAFKRRVYDIHVARASRARPFVANVPADELAAVAGARVKLRTAAAAACERLLAAATSALRDAKARREALALPAEPIAPGSGYRSVTAQLHSWNRNFRDYYDQTRADRARAPGGEHGEQAAELTARHIGGILGAPGFSLHNNGLAIDLVALQGATRLGASTRQRDAWRASWAWGWLSANASRFDFFQNSSIDEPWHWEYRPAGAPSSQPAPAAQQDVPGGPVVAARILWPALGFPAVVAPRAHPPQGAGASAQYAICVLLLSDKPQLTAADAARHLRVVKWEDRTRRRIAENQFQPAEITVRSEGLTVGQNDARGEAIRFGGDRPENSIVVSLSKAVRAIYAREGLRHLHEIRVSERASARLADDQYHVLWNAPAAPAGGQPSSAEMELLVEKWARPRRRELTGVSPGVFAFLLHEYRFDYGALHLPYNKRDPDRRTTEVLHPIFVQRAKPSLRIAHVTDTHVDVRNDVYEENLRQAGALGSVQFNNWNRDFEQIYGFATRPDQGDIVLMTGDLIDYGRGHTGVGHRLRLGDDKAYLPDRNWFLFYYLLASGNRYKKPVYTILGNHDWRLNPYPPFAPAAPPPTALVHNHGQYTPDALKNILRVAHGPGHDNALTYDYIDVARGVRGAAGYIGGDLDTAGSPLQTTIESVIWYLLLINPFLDYAAPLPGGQQLLMLDWGENEEIRNENEPRTFTLGPRASDSLSALQKWHVAEFVKAPGRAKVIGIHAPPLGPDTRWTDEDLRRGRKDYRRDEDSRQRLPDGTVKRVDSHSLYAVRPPTAPHGVVANRESIVRWRDWFIRTVGQSSSGVRMVFSGHSHRACLLVAHHASGDSRLLKAVSAQEVAGARPGMAAREATGRAFPSPLYVTTTSAGPRGNVYGERSRDVEPGWAVATLAASGTIEGVSPRQVGRRDAPGPVSAPPVPRQPVAPPRPIGAR